MVAFILFCADDRVADRLLDRWCAADHSDGPERNAERERSARLARAALRALLDRLYPAKEWKFRADMRGKLFVDDARSGAAGPAVSLSHSGGWVACAVGTRPLGIDVEVRRQRDYAAIADYAFGVRENELVRRDGGAAFYRIWTLREAIGKASGDGLALVTDRRDHADGGPAEGRWTVPNGSGAWLLAHSCPRPEVNLAIAIVADPAADWATELFEEIRPTELL